MRNSRAHGYLHPHDFLVSPDAGSIFGLARTGYRDAGSARGGSLAIVQAALSSLGGHLISPLVGFVANVLFEGGVRVS